MGLLAKMAIGNSRETTTISGTTTVNNGQTTITYPVGIYAVASNSGVHTQDNFVVIPRFGAEMGYQLTCRVRWQAPCRSRSTWRGRQTFGPRA